MTQAVQETESDVVTGHRLIHLACHFSRDVERAYAVCGVDVTDEKTEVSQDHVDCAECIELSARAPYCSGRRAADPSCVLCPQALFR